MNPVSFASEAQLLNTTFSGNGAIQYVSTDSEFLDQFASVSGYKKPRNINEIFEDQRRLCSIDLKTAIYFIYYLRLITRRTVVKQEKLSTVQRGQGLKYESLMRMYYIGQHHPECFNIQNLLVFVAAGSCKDLIQLMEYDYTLNGWENRKLDWVVIRQTILYLLAHESSTDLMRKYLPSIKAESSCKTPRAKARNVAAKYLCSYVLGKKNENYSNYYKQYRLLKSSGTAHQWQKLISRKQFKDIDFGQIHGRALSQLINSKFLENHDLEDQFTLWLEQQTTAKFTGYPYELMSRASTDLPKYKKALINKQFKQLVNNAKEGVSAENRFIAVVDTSGSMSSPANGTTLSCRLVAQSLALFMSHMLEGKFSQHWIEFHSTARLNTWMGDNPVDQFLSANSRYIGSTNFLSVARVFAEVKRKDNLPEEEFPNGIVCFSDCEFDPSELQETNVSTFKKVLLNAGFSKEYVDQFKIVLWNLNNSYYSRSSSRKGYEFKASAENCFYFSGLDASTLSFLFGGNAEDKTQEEQKAPSNPEELMKLALNQELMKYLSIPV